MSKRKGPHADLKRRMRRAGVTYQMIADAYGWSWNHVWRVVNGHRTSEPVLLALRSRLETQESS